MAKTVMGSYSASDMIDHLKQQGGGASSGLAGAPPHRPAPAPAPAPARPYQPPPAYQSPPAYQPPSAPALAPATAANAATMFVPGSGPPAGAFGGNPISHPVGNSPSHASSVPLSAPVPVPAPVAPIPSAAPPYLASQTAARAGRPIEPWKDSLRLMMFIWGGVLLVAFATPLSIDPLVFNWDLIANAEGTAKLPPLIMAAVGVLSIAIAGIPMTPTPRGIIAALLGLAGILVPILLAGTPAWQSLVVLAGLLLLIPNLLVRHEYRDSALPRILITIGVVASLLPWLLPQNGSLPLVQLFEAAIELPGTMKVLVLLVIGQIAIVVLSLLAWLPAPTSGGAKIFAWLLILWPAIALITALVLSGQIENVVDAPAIALGWVGASGAGGSGLPTVAGFGAAYAILIGFGIATVVGKKLE